MIDPTAIYTFSWINSVINKVLYSSTGLFTDPNLIKCAIHPSFSKCPSDKNHNENISDMTANQLKYSYPKSRLKYEVITRGILNQTYSEDLNLEVKECLPNENPTHPLPFPYHELTDKDKDSKLDYDAAGNLNK